MSQTDATRLAPSIGQRVVWLMEHYRGASGALNCHLLFRIRGDLDVAALREALNVVADRHTALRTTFEMAGHRLRQLVHESLPIRVAEVDLAGADASEDALDAALGDELTSPVELAVGPWRVVVYRLSEQHHVLAVVVHHLVTDGWSLRVMAKEIGTAYEIRTCGTGSLPRVEWQYTDFVEWQNSRLTGEALRTMQSRWATYLTDAQPPRLPRLDAPTDGVVRAATEVCTMSPPDWAAVHSTARAQKLTTFTLALTAFFSVIRNLIGQGDISVGSLAANRANRRSRGTIGFFANLVIIRANLEGATTLLDAAKATQRGVLFALANQEMPVQMLPAGALPASYGRPEETVFQMAAIPAEPLQISGCEVEYVRAPDGLGNRFDFEVSVVPLSQGGASLLVDYAANRFNATWAREFLWSFHTELSRIAIDIEAPLVWPA